MGKCVRSFTHFNILILKVLSQPHQYLELAKKTKYLVFLNVLNQKYFFKRFAVGFVSAPVSEIQFQEAKCR